jgi:hypothetical protein
VTFEFASLGPNRAASESAPHRACRCALIFTARSLPRRQFQYIKIQPNVKHEMVLSWKMVLPISMAKDMPDKSDFIVTRCLEKDA